MDYAGDRIKGECVSADASGGVAVTLYDSAGNVRALAAGETIVVLAVQLTSDVATRVYLYNGTGAAAAAGERVADAPLSATVGSVYPDLGDGSVCKRGVGLKVKAGTAGNVVVLFTGVIIRGL
jgi:hypothetical protein